MCSGALFWSTLPCLHPQALKMLANFMGQRHVLQATFYEHIYTNYNKVIRKLK